MAKPSSAKKPKSRLVRIAGLGFAVVGFCGLGGFFILAKMVRDDAARLPSQLEIAKQRGLPLTADDIKALTPKKDERDNAANLYKEAIKKLPPPPKVNIRATPRRYSRSEWRQHLRDLARIDAPAVALVHKAVQLPYLDFERDLSKGFDLGIFKTPDQNEWRISELAGALMTTASARQIDHDLDGALGELEAVVRMYRQEPEYAPLQNRTWMASSESNVATMLIYILNQHHSDPKVVRRIESLVDLIRIPDLYKSIETEFVMGRATLYRIKSFNDLGLNRNTPQPFNKAADGFLQTPGFREAFDSNYVKRVLHLFDLLPKDHQDWESIRRAIMAIDQEADKDRGPTSSVVRVLMPTNPYAVNMTGMLQARLRILQTMLRLLKDYTPDGPFPPTLPNYGPISVDPFSKKSLDYHPMPSGFNISSIGPREIKFEGVNFHQVSGRNMKIEFGYRFRSGREKTR